MLWWLLNPRDPHKHFLMDLKLFDIENYNLVEQY